MKTKILEVYLTEGGWAYEGVYQKISSLRGIKEVNEKLWTMLGALLLEINALNVVIYNDSRLVEEWNEQIKFASQASKSIAVRLKNELVKKFVSFEVKKLDKATIEGRIKDLQLS